MTLRKLMVAVVATTIVTLCGQVTVAGAIGITTPSKTGPRASVSERRLRAAAPVLRRLIVLAGSVAREEEEIAGLAEEYDETGVSLRAARREILRSARELARETRNARAERTRLREAAIEAYVTGQSTAVQDSLLSNAMSSSSMLPVYASVATGHLALDLRDYLRAAATLRHTRDRARAAARALVKDLRHVSAVRREATGLEAAATERLARVKAKLLRLVGPKEFARLVSPVPLAGIYRGPDLAGTAVSRLASETEGRRAVQAAERFLGVPYQWGGASRAGVDCSGLTMLAWASVGIPLEHSATEQWEASEPVPLTHLEPGDLLFYHFAHDGNTPITHVVMYVGSGPFGVATILQAAHTGTDVSYGAMFFAGLVGAGRP